MHGTPRDMIHQDCAGLLIDMAQRGHVEIRVVTQEAGSALMGLHPVAEVIDMLGRVTLFEHEIGIFQALKQHHDSGDAVFDPHLQHMGRIGIGRGADGQSGPPPAAHGLFLQAFAGDGFLSDGPGLCAVIWPERTDPWLQLKPITVNTRFMTAPNKSHGRLSIRASTEPRELLSPNPRQASAWQARVITLFPDAFPGLLGESLTGKALKEGLWALETIDLRNFGEGRHRNVDDTPAGGGAGMVMRPDVVGRAIRAAAPSEGRDKWPIIYLSPRGAPLTQAMARRFSHCDGVTLLCGRFEGVDERVINHFGIEEVSIGDFVLTNGEMAAQVLIDATVRLIPRVLGNQASVEDESFSDGLLEHPQYTRPAIWEGHEIPGVLLSGHHAKITAWRRAEAERLTKERRPDLWRAYCAKHGRDPGEDQEL